MTTRVLYLMRHAAAAETSPTHRDLDRPLTHLGREAATATGAWLREHAPAIESIVISPSVRTRQTAEQLGLEIQPQIATTLYNSGSNYVRRIVSELDEDIACALIIGHAPGIPALVHELKNDESSPVALAAVESDYPAATLSRLEFDGEWSLLSHATACARLTHVHRP